MAFRQVLFNGGLVLITIIILSIAENTTENDKSDSPSYVVLHYDVNIQLFYEENILIGNSSILIEIKESDFIQILMDLKSPCFILQITLIGLTDNIRNQSFAVSYSKFRNQTFWLYFPSLPSGIYRFRIIYSRFIIDNRSSKSMYPNEIEDKMFNVLRFKEIKGRDIVPCISHCEGVATFTIGFYYPSIYQILSNMPIIIETTKIAQDDLDMQWIQHDKTSLSIDDIKIIITELVPFYNLQSTVAFWCEKEETEDVEYAKNIASSVIQYLHAAIVKKNIKKLNYVTINLRIRTEIYEKAKSNKNSKEIQKETAFIEQLKREKWIPDEIMAREFILHRITDIIYNKKLNTIMRKINVAHLIAKQIVSIWFDDVFLWSFNSFTTFYGAYILDEMELKHVIDEKIMDLYVVQIQQESLRYHTYFTVQWGTLRKRRTISRKTSRKINRRRRIGQISKIRKVREHPRSPVLRSNGDHMKLFALWRMLKHLIPNNVFWTGIHTHAQMLYNNSVKNSDDLWTIMQTLLNKETNERNKFDIKKVMDSWTRIKYYPVLNVKRNYSDSSMKISYVKSINIDFINVDNMTEILIPVTYITQSLFDVKTNDLFWLNFDNESKKIENINNNDWVLVNIEQIGYYRVNYDTENWLKLAHYLNSTSYNTIHVTNQAQIVDDAFYFLMKRDLNLVTFWHIVTFLSRDTNFIAWYPMIKALEYMSAVFSIFNMQSIIEEVNIMLNGVLQKIDFHENLDGLLKCLKEEVVKWAFLFRIPKYLYVSTSVIEKHFVTNERYSPLAWDQWTYCKGFIPEIYGDMLKLESAWDKWMPTDYRILDLFTCSASPQIFLQYWLHDKTKTFFSHIEANKHANVFLLMVARHANNHTVQKYILQEFKHVKPTKVGTIATLIVLITHIHDIFRLDEINAFARNNPEAINPTKVQNKLLNYIKKKIKTRRHEYAAKINDYGGLLLVPI